MEGSLDAFAPSTQPIISVLAATGSDDLRARAGAKMLLSNNLSLSQTMGIVHTLRQATEQWSCLGLCPGHLIYCNAGRFKLHSSDKTFTHSMATDNFYTAGPPRARGRESLSFVLHDSDAGTIHLF